MATQPIPNVAQVQMRYLKGTETLENVYHVSNNVPFVAGDMILITAAFVNWYGTNQKSLLPADILLVSVRATDLTSLDGAVYEEVLDPPEAGTNVSPSLPNNVTIAIKENIGKRGRGRSGRVFWPALTESQVDDNTVETAVITSILDSLQALSTAIQAIPGEYNLAVAHRYLDGVKLAVGTHDTVVSLSVTDTTVDSQRTRLPNHKRASKRTAIP